MLAAHLTDTIGRHDLDLAGELRATAATSPAEQQLERGASTCRR